MTSPSVRRSFGAFALAVAALAATTQAGEVPRFASGTNLVVLSATAVDRRGRPVTNLRQAEFRVLEDGRPQRVQHFSEARDPARAPAPARRRQRQHDGRAEDHQREDGRHPAPGRHEGGGPGRAGRLRPPVLGARALHHRPRPHPARHGRDPSPSAPRPCTTRSITPPATWPPGVKAGGPWWWSRTAWTRPASSGPTTCSPARRPSTCRSTRSAWSRPSTTPNPTLFTGRERPAAATAGTEVLDTVRAPVRGGQLHRERPRRAAARGRHHPGRAEAPVPAGI